MARDLSREIRQAGGERASLQASQHFGPAIGSQPTFDWAIYQH